MKQLLLEHDLASETQRLRVALPTREEVLARRDEQHLVMHHQLHIVDLPAVPCEASPRHHPQPQADRLQEARQGSLLRAVWPSGAR